MGRGWNRQNAMRLLSGALGAHFASFFRFLFLTSILHRFFVDSMCCARTAALHCGNEKQKVNASKVFLQQSLQHVEKCRQERNVCQHMANLGLQNRGWSVPSREKNDQKGRQMQQDAKNAPKKRLRAKNVPT